MKPMQQKDLLASRRQIVDGTAYEFELLTPKELFLGADRVDGVGVLRFSF